MFNHRVGVYILYYKDIYLFSVAFVVDVDLSDLASVFHIRRVVARNGRVFIRAARRQCHQSGCSQKVGDEPRLLLRNSQRKNK